MEGMKIILIKGGPIITMNDNQPTVEAVGIEEEKIIAVGSVEEVKNKLGNKYDLIELKGNTLLPGFIDCHIHPISSLFFEFNLNLAGVKSLKELQELLQKTAREKKPNEFILGLNLTEENFDNPILPTRWDLDDACSENPIFLIRHDGHLVVANSKALELAEINRDTKAPEGGEIQKEKNGEITGILTEHATDLLISKIPIPDSNTIKEAASNVFKDFAKKGITSIHGFVELDRGGVENLGGISIPILKLIKEQIPQNYYSVIFTKNPRKLNRIKKSELDDGKTDGKFKVGCLKIWADGTFGASTAFLFEPFTDQPEKCGFLVNDEDEIYQRMIAAHNLKYQIAIHAIGDKANRIVVDLYKKLLKEYPRKDHRHRIEHASMLTADVLKDMKELDLIASCQPPFIISDCPWLEERIGKERFKYTYAFKSIVNAGIILAAGSDCPVEDPNPILGLHALITRFGFVPEECLSIEEALKSYTINGAYAAFEENIKGSIEVGKLADFVILDKNPLEVPKDKIREIKVLETIIRGKTAFKNNN